MRGLWILMVLKHGYVGSNPTQWYPYLRIFHGFITNLRHLLSLRSASIMLRRKNNIRSVIIIAVKPFLPVSITRKIMGNNAIITATRKARGFKHANTIKATILAISIHNIILIFLSTFLSISSMCLITMFFKHKYMYIYHKSEKYYRGLDKTLYLPLPIFFQFFFHWYPHAYS